MVSICQTVKVSVIVDVSRRELGGSALRQLTHFKYLLVALLFNLNMLNVVDSNLLLHFFTSNYIFTLLCAIIVWSREPGYLLLRYSVPIRVPVNS